MSTNIEYPVEEYNWSTTNYIVNPDHFALIGQVTPTMWRCSYADKGVYSREELVSRVQDNLHILLPGNPVKVKVLAASPYRLNNRCASAFRKGRVLLCGDAAHLANPFGGYGLTGGILDAGCVADALISHLKFEEPEVILDKYSIVRREVFTKYVDPWSRSNVERLYTLNPDEAHKDPFFQNVAAANGNPDKAAEMLNAPICIAG